MYDHFASVEHGDYTPIWRGVIETKTFGYDLDDRPCFLTDYTPVWRSGDVIPGNIQDPFESFPSLVEIDEWTDY